VLNEDSTFSSTMSVNKTFSVMGFPVPIDTTITSSGTWISTESTITFTDAQGTPLTVDYDLSTTAPVLMANSKIELTDNITVTLNQTWEKQ